MSNNQVPLASVCLITYNHVNFIGEAIESILQQQTSFLWEIIIADDCSTDGTTEIVKAYGAKFPDKIKLILQDKNVGLHQNFLDLFTTPQSKYVACLDGDDVWIDNNRLQKQVDYLEQNADCAMVYGKHLLMDESGNTITYKNIPAYKSGYIFNDIILCKYLPPICAAVIRNSELKNIYINKTEPGVDFYLLASICKNNKVAYLDEFFFRYRINAASITNSQSPFIAQWFEENMKLFEKEFPTLVKKGLKKGRLNLLYHSVDRHPDLNTIVQLINKFDFTILYLRKFTKCLLKTTRIIKHKP